MPTMDEWGRMQCFASSFCLDGVLMGGCKAVAGFEEEVAARDGIK